MTLPLLLVTILGMIWGSSTTLAKLALAQFGVFSLVLWYGLVALLVLALVGLVRGKRPPLDLRHVRYYVMTGLLGFAIPALNNVIVLQHVPAGVLSAVIATAPVFTYAIALLAGQEQFRPMRAIGVGLGLVGVFCIILPRSSLPDASMAPWVAMGMATPFLYGLTAVAISRYMPRETDSPTLAVGFLSVACLAFGIGVLANGEALPPWPPVWPASHAVLAMGALSSAAYVLYFQIIRLAGAVYLSQVGYLVVAVGVMSGMAVFGERHSLWVWLGIGLMLFGLTLVNLGQRKAAKPG